MVAAAVCASLFPVSTLPEVNISDKAGHLATYGLLTLWFCGVYPRRAALVVGIALLAMGVTLEGLQAFTESRTPEAADLLANAAGILIGLVLARSGLDRWCAMVESLLGANH